MSETKQINIHPYPAFEMYVENDFVVKAGPVVAHSE